MYIQAGMFTHGEVYVFLLDGLYYGNLTFRVYSSISRETSVTFILFRNTHVAKGFNAFMGRNVRQIKKVPCVLFVY